MKAKALTAQPASSSSERLRRLFQRSIEQRSTLAATAEKMHLAPSVLWRMAHEAQFQPLDRALEAIEEVGLTRASFFSELAREESLAAGGSPSPVVWLRFYRDESPADPFLEEITPALLDLLAGTVKVGGESRRARLWAIEERRQLDAAAARQQIEEEIRLLMYGAECESARLGDLALALAIRASVHRQRGQRGAATDDLAIAFELGQRAQDPWVLGIWHQKAPWLLYDAGRCDLALELLEPALRHFFTAGALEEANQLFVDRAILLVELGRVVEAKAEYTRALERLSPASWRHRMAAHLNLALICQREGRLEVALRELESAAKECREQDLSYAFLRRRGGEILCALGKPAMAVPLFEQALQLFTVHGETADVAGVALHLTEALLRAGERPRAHALARDISALFGRKREDNWMRVAREAFDDLVALAEMGRLTQHEVAEVRERIEAGSASPPRRAARRSPSR